MHLFTEKNFPFDETAKDVHFSCTIYFQLFYNTIQFFTKKKKKY